MSSRKKQSHAKKYGRHGTGTTMPKLKMFGKRYVESTTPLLNHNKNQPLFTRVIGQGKSLITSQLKRLEQEVSTYAKSYNGDFKNFENDLPSETKCLARTLLENINKSEADSLFITQSKQEYENIMNPPSPINY